MKMAVPGYGCQILSKELSFTLSSPMLIWIIMILILSNKVHISSSLRCIDSEFNVQQLKGRNYKKNLLSWNPETLGV